MNLPIVYKANVVSDDSVTRFMALAIDVWHKTKVAETDELELIFRADQQYAVKHSSALAAARELYFPQG